MTLLSDPPRRVSELNRRIQGVANDRGVPLRRIQRAVANAILGQMLPSAVVKGGIGLKFRVGERATRFTPDFDVALGGSVDDFEDELGKLLRTGWYGFTGVAIRGEKRTPDGVPEPYVMQPFAVKMAYRSKAWLTIDLEIGHDELGCVEDPDRRMPADVVEIFTAIGLPAPTPVRVLKLEHQIAQKLHAVTYPGSERAHDLVDLQLLWGDSPDLGELGSVAERLFRFRQQHQWPPVVTVQPGWATRYNEAALDLTVEQDVDAAVDWLRARIGEVVAVAG